MSTITVLAETTVNEVSIVVSPDKGNSTVAIYKVSATQPDTPTGDNPVGWLSYQEPGQNWISTGVKTAGGVLVGVWSTPVMYNGAATIEVGTVTTGAAGSDAAVNNSGSSSAAVLDFTIPRGDTGKDATIAVGTVVTGDAGSEASVENVGDVSDAVFNFSIPKGDHGDAATIAVGTVTTGAAGSAAVVENSGTSGDAVLDFTIPQGVQGVQGVQGPQGVQGVQGPQGVQGEAATLEVRA